MEMKIQGNAFYVLEAGDVKAIYDTVPNAIDSLKNIVNQKSIDPTKANIYTVNIGKEGKWEIKTVSWAEIAMELLKKK